MKILYNDTHATFTLSIEQTTTQSHLYRCSISNDKHGQPYLIVHQAMDNTTGETPTQIATEEQLLEALELLKWSIQNDPTFHGTRTTRTINNIFGPPDTENPDHGDQDQNPHHQG